MYSTTRLSISSLVSFLSLASALPAFGSALCAFFAVGSVPGAAASGGGRLAAGAAAWPAAAGDCAARGTAAVAPPPPGVGSAPMHSSSESVVLGAGAVTPACAAGAAGAAGAETTAASSALSWADLMGSSTSCLCRSLLPSSYMSRWFRTSREMVVLRATMGSPVSNVCAPSRSLKGFSMVWPISSAPTYAQQIAATTGIVSQPSSSTRAKGSAPSQIVRKRLRCLEYDIGTGVRNMRSSAPIASTRPLILSRSCK
mmetsp:Transcript_19134/g.60837  ORF Transcript_19134/g.60837 Transcript_19134/m.60837 type:complete len:256 (-) Transcript_19134:830-1597(-)